MYKPVRSNPYLVSDICLMNATQYKNRAIVRVNTETKEVIINAFDIKIDKTENGKTFIKKSLGEALFINIEELEIDNTITPISEYVKEDDHEVIQQKLFE